MLAELLLLCFCMFAQLCAAETGKIVVQVQDVHHLPVKGVGIGIDGIGGSGVTGDDGKVVLALGNDAKEGELISLAVLHSPPGKDLVMVSPWDNRAIVPPFSNKAENFIRIVVVQRGDRIALENGSVLAALTSKINKAAAPRPSEREQFGPNLGETPGENPGIASARRRNAAAPEDTAVIAELPFQTNKAKRQDAAGMLRSAQEPKDALKVIAEQYGLEPDELDKLIRRWGAKTVDPYEAGLAALYEQNYLDATDHLQASLDLREKELARDQKAEDSDRKAVLDAAFFLGSGGERWQSTNRHLGPTIPW
jgi:hypothetical protein